VEESNWPKEIKNKKLVVVEGKEDVEFFVRLLDHIGMKDYFVWGIGGKDEFNNDLPLLAKVAGFSDITHLAVVRDKNGEDAFDSVVNILKRKMGFVSVPKKPGIFTTGRPRLGIFIMPGKEIEGNMLEDLCLKMVESHQAMQCVKAFAECVSNLVNPPKNISKAKVQAYLAAQPEVANTIGRGAQKGYWDFDSPCLNELTSFLKNLES